MFSSTVGDIIDATSARAQRVRMSRDYLVFLGSMTEQDSDRKLHFNFKETRFMFVPEGSDSEYHLISPDDITASGVTFPSLEKNYVFRKAKGIVEILR